MSDPATLPLRGRHALITGAARGIGRAAASALARLGADLTITSRDAASLDAAACELASEGEGKVHAAILDLSAPDGAAAIVAEAAAVRGPVTILVNNAGVGPSMPIAKTGLQTFRDAFEINVIGAFACAQAALPAMLEAGDGRIVNIASTAGLIGYSYCSAYAASKHALVGMTRAMALELARTGVTVNAVCPGFSNTDLARQAIDNIVEGSGRSADEARDLLVKRNPQRRLVEPAEVGEAVAWLCLPSSLGINGHALTIDGGEVI